MIIWIALIGLAVAAIALVVNHDAGTVLGVETDSFAHLVALSALAVVIGAAVLRRFRGRLGASLKAAGIWSLIAALLVTAYTLRHDAEAIAHRVIAELVPGMAITSADGSVAVAKSGDGHFALEATVNGAPVRFLLDTGASLVVLTADDAESIGIDPASLAYSLPVWTANGRTSAAQIVLDRIEIGSIRVERVRAAIAQPGMLRESLLGMSFLDRIPTWRVERDRLILGG